MNIRGVVAHERGPAGRERARPLVRADVRRMRIEYLVVRVGDDHLLALLAHDGEVRLVAEVDDLLVAAVANEDRDGPGAPIGNEVDRALYGGEITAAVRCHDHARRVCRWRASPGR